MGSRIRCSKPCCRWSVNCVIATRLSLRELNMKKMTVILGAVKGFLCMAMSTQLLLAQSTKPAPTPNTGVPNRGTESGPPVLTPSFRKMLWKAQDACDRIDLTLSKDHKTSKQDDLVLEAKKAIDEAKYEAITAVDLKYLHAIQMEASSLELQELYPLGDDTFEKYHHRVEQCRVEVVLEITPSDLSAKGAAMAALGTCNLETSDWPAGFR